MCIRDRHGTAGGPVGFVGVQADEMDVSVVEGIIGFRMGSDTASFPPPLQVSLKDGFGKVVMARDTWPNRVSFRPATVRRRGFCVSIGKLVLLCTQSLILRSSLRLSWNGSRMQIQSSVPIQQADNLQTSHQVQGEGVRGAGAWESTFDPRNAAKCSLK